MAAEDLPDTAYLWITIDEEALTPLELAAVPWSIRSTLADRALTADVADTANALSSGALGAGLTLTDDGSVRIDTSVIPTYATTNSWSGTQSYADQVSTMAVPADTSSSSASFLINPSATSSDADKIFFAIQDSGTDRFTIDKEGDAYLYGNIGIGKTSPGSALDVKGTLRLSGSTSGYVGLAPAASAGSTTYTLPASDGTSGYALTTNGSGTLSWSSVTASGSAGGDLTGTYPNPTITTDAVSTSEIADGTITNSDISSTAAIAYSKLSLASSITSSDITDATIAAGDIGTGAVTTTGILDGTIANADVSSSAAIAYSKLNLSGSITTTDITDATITTSDISGTAAITDAQISNTLTASILAGSGSTTDAADLATAEVAGTLAVGNGGTGATTLAANGVLYGNTTSAVQATTAGTSGQLLVANGSGTPVFVTMGTDATLSSAGALTIASDAVGAAEIADPTRCISIPLRSFIDCSTDAGADLNFTSGADTYPDFINSSTDGQGFSIQFDDASGTEDQNAYICSQTAIPADYSSGASLRVRASKDAHSGATEIINCNVSVNGGSLETQGSVTTSATASTSYTCTPTIASLSANDSLGIALWIGSGTTMDDTVSITSVQFCYTATQ